MTLIAGTICWKGICIGADTRVTHTDGITATYTDDAQKIDMLPSGLGIAVAGNCDTATIFREILVKNLASNERTDDSYDGPARIVREIIEESLREMEQDRRVYNKPADQTAVSGFIAGIDAETSLRLNTSECQQIVGIIGTEQVHSSIWTQYKNRIKDCANGEVEFIELAGLPNSMLFSFRSQLASGITSGILDVERVPFGEIRVFGTGKSKDHHEQQNKTLLYLLFNTEPDEIDNAAFHILRTHGWSEKVVPPNAEFNFQTFGGGYLSGAFLETPNIPGSVTFRASLGEIYRDPEHTDLVCSIYPNSAGELCVKTGEGKDWVLKKFWEYPRRVIFIL